MSTSTRITFGVVLAAVCIGSAGVVGAQSFTSTPVVPIPDNTVILDTIDVTSAIAITDVDVALDINHTWIGDLEIILTSPSGTTVDLYSLHCGQDDDLCLVLDDEAGAAVGTGCNTPYSGSFIPVDALAQLDGENAQGTWTLSVEDTAAGNSGTLVSWSIDFGAGAPPLCCDPPPGPNVTITCTPNLPLVGDCAFMGVPDPVAANPGDFVTWTLDPACATSPCPTVHPTFTVDVPVQPGFPAAFVSPPLSAAGLTCTSAGPFFSPATYNYGITGSDFDGTIVVEAAQVPTVSMWGLILLSVMLIAGLAWRRA